MNRRGARPFILVGIGFGFFVALVLLAWGDDGVRRVSPVKDGSVVALNLRPTESESAAVLYRAPSSVAILHETLLYVPPVVHRDAGLSESGAVAVFFRVSSPDAGVDTPLPFAPNIPHSHTPKGFEAVAQRAVHECGMGLDVVAIDCSEFPCLLWTLAKNDNVGRFTMDGCKPWDEAFEFGAAVVGAIQTLDGGIGPRYFSWMPILPDPDDQRIAMKRARERNEGMKQALGIQ